MASKPPGIRTPGVAAPELVLTISKRSAGFSSIIGHDFGSTPNLSGDFSQHSDAAIQKI